MPREEMMKKQAQNLLMWFFPVLLLVSAAVVIPVDGAAQTIVDEWTAVKVPPAPPLKEISVDPKTTALLMLDFNKQTCNAERRPRCIASIAKTERLLALARRKGMPVVYSLSAGATTADIAQALAPGPGEQTVTSGPDKFFGTDLEKILNEKGVKTVICVGTAAHGAVLYTASAAAFRGLQVIVPVDGMSAEDPFAELYTAWHLVNGPRVSTMVSLSRIDMIR
jgi:nicotinamidase-related amidase